MRNRSGSTVPWGTPDVTFDVSDIFPSKQPAMSGPAGS